VRMNGGESLVAFKEGNANRVLVKDWSETKNLGIRLQGNAPAAPATTLAGDFKKATDGRNYVINGNNYVGADEEIGALDLLTGTGGNDVIDGRAGDDALSGMAGDDYLLGGDGGDILQGGLGKDTLIGGIGDDHLYASSDDPLTLPTRTDFIPPANPYTHPWGTGFNWTAGYDSDTFANGVPHGFSDAPRNRLADDAGNLIDGGAGNDFIAAGTGADTVHGGADKDFIFGMDQDDILFGDGDNDLIYGDGNAPGNGSVVWTTLDKHGNDLIDGGEGDDYLYGQGKNDILFGGQGDDILWGDEDESLLPASSHGDDYLFGGAGKDQMLGGAGDDYLEGGAGDDTIRGGAGQDIYVFNKGDGIDTVVDNTADNNILRFGAGIKKEGITLQHLGSLRLDLGNGDAVHIDGFDQYDVFNSSSVARFEFADGSVLTTAELLARGFDLDGAGGDDTIFGTNTMDRINGLAGNDMLAGDGGADTLNGGEGADSLYGDSGNNTAAEMSNDYLDGGAGNDTLDGVGGSDTLLGGADNDVLYGDSINTPAEAMGNDSLDGGEGDDTLVGWCGADTLIGGAGNDLMEGDGTGLTPALFGDDVLEGGVGNDTLQGNGGNDHLEGSEGNDNLFGDASRLAIAPHGDDTLIGGAGHDYLDAGYGNDILDGGDGDDVLVVDTGSGIKHVSGGSGIDTLLVGDAMFSAARLRLGALGSLVIDTGVAGSEIHIDAFNADIPDAGCGIERFQFIDRVVNDAQLLARGFDLNGTAGEDVIQGSGINDRIDTGDSNDLVRAGGGHDQINGGAGADTMDGGNGDDVFLVDAAGDLVIEAANGGTDQVNASIDSALAENVENLVLTGSAIRGAGNALANRLTGNNADNVLDGGVGADTMIGGAGNDTYVVDNAGDVVSEGAGAGTDVVQSSVTHTLAANVENLTLTGATPSQFSRRQNLGRLDTQRFRNPNCITQRQIFLAPLDYADIGAVQARLERKRLLRPARLNPDFPNGKPQALFRGKSFVHPRI